MSRVVRALLIATVLLTSALPMAAQAPPPAEPLKLPPGMVQTLPVAKGASYFGDAVRIVNCPRDEDNPFGLCGNTLFGGIALMDSHLEGLIQIRFFPPVNNISRFEITHPGNLVGQDTVIKAPQFYEMPVRENFVLDSFTQVSGGELNLVTGQVTNLQYHVLFANSWYSALQNANPRLRAGSFAFPGGYGTVHAEFHQRADGLLDFTFEGQTFAPLGKSIGGEITRMPLPLCGPLLQCASVEAPGTSLHPHIRISTREPADPPCGANCPQLTPNTVRVFNAFVRQTTLGDNFNLNSPEQGGRGFARSHMNGRVVLQLGAQTGDFIPFAISTLPPEALLAEPPAEGPRGLSLGVLGTWEFLHFPRLTYFYTDVFTADDPFDIQIGHLNVKTGRQIGELNYRSFFVQSILVGLLSLNPGLAQASQIFRGPLAIESGVNGQTILRFNGEIFVPFAGIVFPFPDLKSGFVTGPGSLLDLFLRFQAMEPVTGVSNQVFSGSVGSTTSSILDTISYNYSVSCNPSSAGDASFQYTNNSSLARGGTFQMTSLASVRCFNSRGSTAAAGQFDAITFTGFGTWSKDSTPHAATVHISTVPGQQYYHILIDAGFTSQAHNKPATEAETLP